MFNLFSIVLPVFVVLGAGSLLMKMNLLDKHFVATANRLIFHLLLPILLFVKISHSDLSRIFNGKSTLIMIFSVLIIFGISLLVARLLHLPDKSTGTFMMNNFRANYAYMGLPVCLYAFGDEGSAIASIFMAFMVPFVNILSIVALSINQSKSFDLKGFIKNTFLSPIVVACFLGIVFAKASIAMPLFLERSLSMISGATLPLSLLCIGATIDLDQIKGNYLPISLNALIKLFVVPLIGYVLFRLSHTPIDLAEKIAVILLSAPAATVNYVLSSSMDGDPDLATGAIITTTIFSMFSFSFWLYFLSL